jgi:branched-chain amino acid transport system ATP-binding protein
MDPVLRVEGLNKRFGGIVVAESIDLVLPPSTCLGIIGPNGAGKTSLFNLLDGSIRPDSGRILLGETEVSNLPHYRRVRVGIARAYQIPQPFPDLTVFENVLTAAIFGAGLAAPAAARLAKEKIELIGLVEQQSKFAGVLPLLDRKRLELARALAANPRVLLLDEIAGGLTDPEARVLVKLILSLKEDLAMIWIEHVIHALIAAADSIVVLNFGRKIAEGDAATVMTSAEVREVYLGIAVDGAAGS